MMPTCISLLETLSKLDSFPIPSNRNNKIELEDEAVMKNTERGIKSHFFSFKMTEKEKLSVFATNK